MPPPKTTHYVIGIEEDPREYPIEHVYGLNPEEAATEYLNQLIDDGAYGTAEDLELLIIAVLPFSSASRFQINSAPGFTLRKSA